MFLLSKELGFFLVIPDSLPNLCEQTEVIDVVTEVTEQT